MRVVFGIGNIKKKFIRPVLAIGVFDGVHRGHQHLIRKMLTCARRIKGTSVVMTFFPDPTDVLKHRDNHSLLISLEHRLMLLEKEGVDVCIVVGFTRTFSSVSAQEFVNKYLIRKVAPEKVFVGENFRFGKNRKGTVSMLKNIGRNNGFGVVAISSRKSGRLTISATRIKNLIESGRLRAASVLLGRQVSVFGRVEKGDRRGQQLGFPTANIDPAHNVIPPRGIYLSRIIFNGKRFDAMAYIGSRPSFKKKIKSVIVEVHIFNFDRNIYNRFIEIQFIRKIRSDKVFATRMQLIDQLKKDERKARRLFAKRN